jgi:hypothetical protein
MVLSTDPGNGIDTQEFYLLIRQGATEWYQSIVLNGSSGHLEGGVNRCYSNFNCFSI